MGGGAVRLWVPLGVVAAVVVGLVGVAARSNSTAAERHRLRSGTAWLVDARG